MRATYLYGAGHLRVIDRTVSLDETPRASAAMNAREALKVMVRP
jgi:hypothetical protein